jgi:hypothetical protein
LCQFGALPELKILSGSGLWQLVQVVTLVSVDLGQWYRASNARRWWYDLAGELDNSLSDFAEEIRSEEPLRDGSWPAMPGSLTR